MLIFSPWSFAFSLLEDLGVDFNSIYNERAGIRRSQLKILNLISPDIEAKKNIYKTIHRLESSKNPNLKWDANIKNTLVGTIQGHLMSQFESMPIEKQNEVIIKWIPSSADEQDPIHALNYGKVMTLRVAIKKKLGLRYGCKCGFRVLQGQELIDAEIKKFSRKVTK